MSEFIVFRDTDSLKAVEALAQDLQEFHADASSRELQTDLRCEKICDVIPHPTDTTLAAARVLPAYREALLNRAMGLGLDFAILPGVSDMREAGFAPAPRTGASQKTVRQAVTQHVYDYKWYYAAATVGSSLLYFI